MIELLLLAQCFYTGLFITIDARAALEFEGYHLSKRSAGIIIAGKLFFIQNFDGLAYIVPTIINIFWICPKVMRNYAYAVSSSLRSE